MALAGSQSVAAGATTATVSVSPGVSNYSPGVIANWNTTIQVTAVTATGFTLSFGTPASGTSPTIYWTVSIGQPTQVIVGQLSTLQNYLDDLRRILHDPNDVYWSQADKTVYINKAMQRRDLDTGQNRQVFTVVTTVGQENYTVADTGNAQVFDIVGINLLYNNLRVVLGQYSFTELNAYVRQYSPPLQWAPVGWCRVGPGQIFLAPAPSVAYTTEWDCCLYASPLVNLTDADPLPYPYTNAIPYYAAYWAKMNERQYDEAAEFKTLYDEQINSAQNSRVGMVPSMYGSGMVRI